MTPKSLLAEIALPASVVAKKSSIPTIECLHIDNGRITGTDLERQISAPVDLDLSCCVPADRFQAALKALPPDCELRIDMDKERLRIRGGRSKFMLPVLPVGDFPLQEWVEPDVVVESPQEVAAAIRTVEPAMAHNDVRFYLVGVATQGDALHATNGHWMAKHDCADLPNDIIIPRASIPMMLVAMEEETVRYGVTERGLHIAANGYRLSTKLIEGKYPDTTRYWSRSGFSSSWTVNREQFIATVASVYGMSSRSFPCAELVIEGGILSLRYANGGEDAEAEIACDGPKYRQGFNLEYLVGAARALSGETLTLSTVDRDRGEMFFSCENPAQRYVVMPARL